MAGTPTPYYGFPIPAYSDPADAPHDFEALAQKIEDTLKNGYTIPDGNLVIGDPASTTARSFVISRKVGIDVWDVYFSLHDTFGYMFMLLRKNAVEVNRFIVGADGSFLGLAGGVQRPIPYATWANRGNVTVSAAVNGSAVFTLPAGRFTATPGGNGIVANATVVGVSNYFAYMLTPADNSSVSVGVRHADNTVASTTVGVMVTVTQMTPTTGPG